MAQYPLFGAPFNEVIDYGFDNECLVYPFIKDKQKPSTHENYYWKCSESYCLYTNKDAIYHQKAQNMKCEDYVQSNPIDIIHTKDESDFICHSTGPNQNILRICQLNGKQKLKTGNTFNLDHQIDGISHCDNHLNEESVIMTWNRNQIIYLGMKSAENHETKYRLDIIKQIEAPSNTTFKSAALCSLPYVWSSGIEDTVLFTSNGDLLLFKNKGKKYSSVNLKYQVEFDVRHITNMTQTHIMYMQICNVLRKFLHGQR